MKTLESARFTKPDLARGMRRELSYKKDAEAIQYHSQKSEPEKPEFAPAGSPTVGTTTPRSPDPMPVPVPPITETAAHAAIHNIAPSASDVVLTMVALGLKRPRDQASAGESLKQLCGCKVPLSLQPAPQMDSSKRPDHWYLMNAGQSTLQNEIIGGLAAEFVTLPDRAEDLSPTELAAAVDAGNGSRTLGPCITARMGKCTCAKMPAGCGVSVLRKHLGAPWALRQGLQDACARRGNQDFVASSKTTESLRTAADQLQTDMDLWLAKHGEFYAQNVRPKFDILKARVMPRLVDMANFILGSFEKPTPDRKPRKKLTGMCRLEIANGNAGKKPVFWSLTISMRPLIKVGENGRFQCPEEERTAQVIVDGKMALVTGAGRDSISFELVKLLLTAGTRVLVTTSSYSTGITDHRQGVYVRRGGRGSQLVVVAFNGGSQQGTLALVDYMETQVAPLHASLEGPVDLERVAVIAGFSEIGSYGNSRTRWEVEIDGHFSVQGCVELAGMTGLIKYHNGPLKGSPHYCGWLEASSSSPINKF
ncbi:hypothetical protein DL770_000180 [Monosporascus sp. CRB-9-2]|nr:hypothetical protein DL770_000180 [Monosporascus sp. CRB-9-2]